ncbi:MgtC/SapB transporter [Coriobacterium glomerans PW2]|uniref:MgtC/SapB transporter n=1 Tax=Coriobacterium glomerans (strain ATCC 49209 / DSM 20642 / JCM 10262 / PW2) TaxID=700015 RepID=F2N912_CORGP|nr:MgtC/SapB family protein [Coriobacterium glomerans]AEB07612.1 MgtC/SapB transporter [Coriobacterium glomerans PW2]
MSVLFTLDLFARIALAALSGIIIGFERMSHFKVAGVSTHMTVGLSAALIMVVSKYGFSDSTGFAVDVSRIAAQIVSGVGFLGAGIIIQRDRTVQGLTTAANIWGTAGVGMAYGAGLYVVGIFGTASLVGFHALVHHVGRLQPEMQQTYILKLRKTSDMAHLLDASNGATKLISYDIRRFDKDSAEVEMTLLFRDDKQEQQWAEHTIARKDIVKLMKA